MARDAVVGTVADLALGEILHGALVMVGPPVLDVRAVAVVAVAAEFFFMTFHARLLVPGSRVLMFNIPACRVFCLFKNAEITDGKRRIVLAFLFVAVAALAQRNERAVAALSVNEILVAC